MWNCSARTFFVVKMVRRPVFRPQAHGCRNQKTPHLGVSTGAVREMRTP